MAAERLVLVTCGWAWRDLSTAHANPLPLVDDWARRLRNCGDAGIEMSMGGGRKAPIAAASGALAYSINLARPIATAESRPVGRPVSRPAGRAPRRAAT